MIRFPRFGASAALIVALAGSPAAADSDAAPRLDFDDLKKQLDDAWNSIVGGVEPAMDRLATILGTLDRVDSLDNYEDPVITEDGDIVMRRKEDAPPLPPEVLDDLDPEAGIEL